MEESRAIRKRLGEEKVENENKDKDEDYVEKMKISSLDSENNKSCIISIDDVDDKDREDDDELEEDEDTVIENICAISPNVTIIDPSDVTDSGDEGCGKARNKFKNVSSSSALPEDFEKATALLPGEHTLLFQEDIDKPKSSGSASPSLSWFRRSPGKSRDKGSRKGSRKRTFPGRNRNGNDDKAGSSS